MPTREALNAIMPADYVTPEQYFRRAAQAERECANPSEWVAAFLDRLADNCAKRAAELEVIEDDYVPF